MPSRRHFLITLGGASAAGLAGCTDPNESSYTPGTDDTTKWPMPAYDRGFSAYNPDAAAPRDGVTERWSTEISFGPGSRPVVAAGRVLVPTTGALVALDLATGEERWRHDQEQPWTSAPAVHDGIAYVGWAQVGFAALDIETGDEQWRVKTRGSINAAPTFDHNHDTLFVGDSTGRLYQIDRSTGKVILRGEVFGPVTALVHGHGLLVGTESGEVYRLFPNHHHGEFMGMWRRKVDGWVTTLIKRGNAIFVGTYGGSVYRLQYGAGVGSSRWEAERGSIHLAATSGDVVGSDGGGLRTFDARTGEVEWRQAGHYHAAPAIAGDTIYVGGGELGENGNGFIAAYALSGGTGVGPLTFDSRRWKFDVESAAVEGVAVADGAVFGVTQSLKESPSRVYALDPA